MNRLLAGIKIADCAMAGSKFWTSVQQNSRRNRRRLQPQRLLPQVRWEKDLGTALGTIAYMSPEQGRGKELDSRTDLLSFGAVLYEMSTGREAFASNTPAVTFEAILNGMPTAPVRLNPEVPPRLEEIISKALQKDRDIRYQHASELRTDLRCLKHDVDIGETQGQALWPSNNGRRKVCPYTGGGHGSHWWE